MFGPVAGLVLALIFAGYAPPSPLEVLGRLDPRELPEASGIVKSRQYDGIFWIHNDSGNPPALFAVRRDGGIIRRFALDVPNIDWEDVAIDDTGHLYLGDIGNNGGFLPIRAIYQIVEPDPTRSVQEPLKATRAWFYTFPRGGRFDAESLWIEGNRAVLAAKTHDRLDAGLFALPLDRPSPIFRPTMPTRIGSLDRFSEPATGADLSADGVRLAVCSSTTARIYERLEPAGEASGWRLVSQVAYPTCAVEAICWDGRDLILAGEDQRMSRLTEEVWSRGSQAAPSSKRREDGTTAGRKPERLGVEFIP